MKKYILYLLILLQFVSYLIMIYNLNKWTVLLPFISSTLICIHVMIKQNSKYVTFFLCTIILLSYIMYFYLISDETFPN